MTIVGRSLVIRVVMAMAISVAAVGFAVEPASAADKPKICDFRTGIGCDNNDGTTNGPSAAIPETAQKAIDANNGKTAEAAPITTGTAGFNTTNILKLSNWLEWLALLSCIIGICISSALWAIGSKGQNPGQELTGKKGLILCCTAAFFIGALPGMLNWLETMAGEADETGVVGTDTAFVGGTLEEDGDSQSPTGAGNLNPNVNGGTATPSAKQTGALACDGGNKMMIQCRGQ